jgi:hypothetical protein
MFVRKKSFVSFTKTKPALSLPWDLFCQESRAAKDSDSQSVGDPQRPGGVCESDCFAFWTGSVSGGPATRPCAGFDSKLWLARRGKLTKYMKNGKISSLHFDFKWRRERTVLDLSAHLP